MYEDDTSMGEIGGLLADIREMFPVPERGSELEVALAGAMALPQCVPAYVQMWLNKQQEATKALDDLISENTALRSDAARFNALVGVDHVAVNKWLVQVVTKNSYQSAYFTSPPSGTPEVLHQTKLDALRFAIDQHIRQEENL